MESDEARPVLDVQAMVEKRRVRGQKTDLITCFHAMRNLNPVYRHRVAYMATYAMVTQASKDVVLLPYAYEPDHSTLDNTGISAASQQILEGLDHHLILRHTGRPTAAGPRIGGVVRWVTAVIRAAQIEPKVGYISPGWQRRIDDLIAGHIYWWAARDTVLRRWWPGGMNSGIPEDGFDWFWENGLEELENRMRCGPLFVSQKKEVE
jgi:hypothetical protein